MIGADVWREVSALRNKDVSMALSNYGRESFFYQKRS